MDIAKKKKTTTTENDGEKQTIYRRNNRLKRLHSETKGKGKKKR